MFWLLAAPLLCLAAALVMLPFFRRPSGGASRLAAVRALYRQRLTEFDDDARLGILEAGERDEMEAELGQALLREWPAEESSAAPNQASGEGEAGPASAPPANDGIGRQLSDDFVREPPSQRRPSGNGGSRRPSGWAWLVAGLAVPLAAVGLYLHLGEPDAALLAQAPKVLGLDAGRDRSELDLWRTLLGQRVQSQPDEAGSWLLLGHVYMTDGDYAAAAAAFARVHGLAGEDAGVEVPWLQALFLAADGRLHPGAAALAERILARTPDQPTALEILALDAYGRQDFPAAASLFNRVLANPLAPLRRTALQGAFERARAQLGETAAIEVSITAPQPPPAAAALFVIARPPGGGMPYAVVRRPAAILPQTIRLDDAVSMNPSRPLSAADALEVVARISLAGTAAAHPGDWEWRSEALTLPEAAAPIVLAAQVSPP